MSQLKKKNKQRRKEVRAERDRLKKLAIKIKNDDTLSFSEMDDFNIAVEALDLTIPNNIDSFHKMQTEIELKNHPTIIEFDYRDVYNVNNPFDCWRDYYF